MTSRRHPIVVNLLLGLAALVVPIWAFAADPDTVRLAASCLLGWGLLWLAWIDWHAMRLPDTITLPLLLLGLAATWLVDPGDMMSSIVGALAGFGFFRLVGLGYRALRGTEGLGQGDAKLLAVGGAWLGWEALPWTVLTAALIGLAVVGVARLRGTDVNARTMIPFGPAIGLAIWIGRLHGFPTQ